MVILSDASCYDGTPCVVAMGMFDGLHRGHRALIGAAAGEAARLHAPLVVYTYAQHPLTVLRPALAPRPLMSLAEKASVLSTLGVDVVIHTDFTLALAKTPPLAFLQTLCEQLHPLVLAVGYNHTFGALGQGNADLIALASHQLGYQPLILPPVQWEGAPVSSSRIRKLLAEGKQDEADILLGDK